MAQGSFGDLCKGADSQCKSGLACDYHVVGSVTNTCLSVNGASCSTYADCANNLDCLASTGTCGCDVRICFFFVLTKNRTNF